MKKLLFFLSVLFIIGCSSILAQRGNRPRSEQNGPPIVRNPDSIRIRDNTDKVRDNTDQVRGNTDNPARQRDVGSLPTENRRELRHDRQEQLTKVLRNLNLSNEQNRQVHQILKEARENQTPNNEVLRSINSVLNRRQSEKFKEIIKRIYQD